jgi:hypothetical protein
MDRFLYRLSKTPHRTRFVLKGAVMLHVWEAQLARATKDIDLLGPLENSLSNVERVIREVCVANVEPDGMIFEPAAVKAERSRKMRTTRACAFASSACLARRVQPCRSTSDSGTSSRPTPCPSPIQRYSIFQRPLSQVTRARP